MALLCFKRWTSREKPPDDAGAPRTVLLGYDHSPLGIISEPGRCGRSRPTNFFAT